MGGVLLVAGVIGFVVAVRMSRSAYEGGRPARAQANLPPRPGTGDVPAWISGVYLLSVLAAIVGIIMLLAG